MDNNWKVTIEKGFNGYILIGRFGNSDLEQKRVIEIPDTSIGELTAMGNLLTEIKEYFGLYYSKHNQKNLVIKIEDKENK